MVQKTLKDVGVNVDMSFALSVMKDRQYTWSDDETLIELLTRRDMIMKRHDHNIARIETKRKNLPLVDVLSDVLDDEKMPCTAYYL